MHARFKPFGKIRETDKRRVLCLFLYSSLYFSYGYLIFFLILAVSLRALNIE